MGIWVWMKTTIELPEALFRRAKSMAAQEGVTLKQLLTEALKSRLDMRAAARNGKAAPRWMRACGALRHLRQERNIIERAIESEFEKIDAEGSTLTSKRKRGPTCSIRCRRCWRVYQ